MNIDRKLIELELKMLDTEQTRLTRDILRTHKMLNLLTEQNINAVKHRNKVDAEIVKLTALLDA